MFLSTCALNTKFPERYRLTEQTKGSGSAKCFICLGPVVQSIVSLTTSLRHQLIKYMPTKLSNTLLFFVGKM